MTDTAATTAVAPPVTGWSVAAGDPVTATIPDPPGGLYGHNLGARVEMPYTRAIVSPYQLATADGNGNWTVTLDPVLMAGGFNFVWRTDDAEPPYYEVFLPLAVTALSSAGANGDADYPLVDRDSVKPTVDEVARLERTRTFHDDGTEVETFDSETRPTDLEVSALIEQATDFVLGFLPQAFDPEHYDSTKQVIALYTAMLIEGSWFKEQNQGNALPWEAEYTIAVQRLEESINEDRTQANLPGEMEPRTPYTYIWSSPPFNAGSEPL